MESLGSKEWEKIFADMKFKVFVKACHTTMYMKKLLSYCDLNIKI